jgi:pentatricopeptide repeat protein
MNNVNSSFAEGATGICPAPESATSAGRERLAYGGLLAGLFAFVFLCGFFRVSDVDVGYHIRTGAYILEHHHIPTTNFFSYTTPGEKWPIQQWWPGIFYNRVYHFGGVAALISVKAGIAALLMMVILGAARRFSGPGSWWPFWLVTIGALIARVRFFERPDLISALIFALVFYLDLRFDKDRRWQWIALPLLMGFWANTHGGLVYGAVLLCVTSAAEWVEHFWNSRKCHDASAPSQPGPWKSLLIRPVGLALSLLACVLSLELINPNGWRVMLVPVDQFTSNFWQATIAEYQTPAWRSAPLFYLSLAAIAILQLLTWRHLRLRFLFVAIVFAYLAWSAQRSLLYYAIAAIPCAAFLISRLPEARALWRLRRLEPLLLPVVWAGLVFIVIIPNKTLHFGVGFYAPYYPVEIYSFIEKQVPPQNMFHNMRYGGGILWFLYPRFKPFLDGRGDAYTPEFWQKEYFPVIYAQPGWRDILRKYDAHAAWLPIARTKVVSDLAKQLFADPDWALVAFTDESLFFLERTELNRGVISTNEFRYIWPGDLSFSNVTAATLKGAVVEAERAFALSPDSLFARNAVARTRLMAGDYGRAAVFYAALEAEAGNAEAFWRDYGYCLFKLGKFQEADAIFARMIEKGWLVGYAWYMRHFLALEFNQFAEAELRLAKAIAAEPANEEYRNAQASLRAASKRAAVGESSARY